MKGLQVQLEKKLQEEIVKVQEYPFLIPEVGGIKISQRELIIKDKPARVPT